MYVVKRSEKASLENVCPPKKNPAEGVTKIPALAVTGKRKFLQTENPPPPITLLRIVLRGHIYQYL